MLDWQTLIEERNEWVAHNFPDHKLPRPQESILGLVEEVGELAHSHLKELQNIRGTAEEHQANAKDAAGDATVYLLGVLSHYKVVPVPGHALPAKFLGRLRTTQSCIFEAARWAGQLDTSESSLAASMCMGKIVEALNYYCLHREWNYQEIVVETWSRVKQRDWIANPQNGGEDTIDLDDPALELDRPYYGE